MASNQNFIYREWQYPRISSFLPLLLFIPAVWIVAAPFDTNLGIFIGAGFAILGAILKISSAKYITVSSDSISLGDATIPRRALGSIEKIDQTNQFAERGSKLDARAFVFIKYGLPEMIKIENTDTKDPTPYLLISTRNAEKLIDALA